MTSFKIASEVADLLPTMQVVVVTAKGLNNHAAKPEVTAHVQVCIADPSLSCLS